MDKQTVILINFFLPSICVLLAMTSANILLNDMTDKAALLAFKLQITNDPRGALRSWNDTADFCNWEGISCSKKNRGRVVSINLNYQLLTGHISSSIKNLSFLHHMDLERNQFFGMIPPALFKLPRIHFLNLAYNSLQGEIPSNLSSSLKFLDLTENYISGSIPSSFGHLSKLNFLSLYNNSFTGKIPPSLGNLSSLQQLYLSWNQFEGRMPEEIGNLRSLQFLEVAKTKLSGELPASLFNLSSVYFFNLVGNNFEGMIPTTFGNDLPNLQYLYMSGNQFKGPIPDSLTNASKLMDIDMSYNSFNGIIPSILGRLRLLTGLNLAVNQLEANDYSSWEFLDALTNCSQLKSLYLYDNKLNGTFPSSITNLSTKIENIGISRNYISGHIPLGIGNLLNLKFLNLGQNHLIGAIPESIGKLTRLQTLSLYECKLTGTLPFSIGNLTQLFYLYLYSNDFNGQIPPSIGNLTQLFYLYLDSNDFNGYIPPSIGNLKNLQNLCIDRNNLKGNIPKEIFTLPSILILKLAFNSLTGPIPLEIGDLIYVKELYLQKNKLFGEIPRLINGCMSLEVLDLSSNMIQGTIPPSIGDLRSLMILELSENNLIGQIPEDLGMLRGLQYLNLSFNHLVGEVPSEGIFLNATAVSLQGNYGLCGGLLDLHLSSCPRMSSFKKKGQSQLSLLEILLPSLLAFFFILFSILLFKYRRTNLAKNSSNPEIIKGVYPKVSYTELLRATNGFSAANLLGIGQHGSVYKGSLDNYGHAIVAIKVFNLQQRGASRAFVAECKALSHISHQNLVKIITCSVGIDSKGDDFMAIVFEFMQNGNLDTWLHGDDIKHFDLIKRLDIAINIANALCYLHHECETPIIHCDLKPCNVLLNGDMVAHVGDFGLARLLHRVESNPLSDFDQSTPAIRGTIGYAAPEYGLGSQVSTMGDVYSYGIILLELFTGRRPVDKIFKDGLNLHKFVKMAIPNGVMEVIDPNLQLQFQDEAKNCIQLKRPVYECLTSILQLSLLCSNESARERISIADAIVELHSIKDAYFKVSL